MTDITPYLAGIATGMLGAWLLLRRPSMPRDEQWQSLKTTEEFTDVYNRMNELIDIIGRQGKRIDVLERIITVAASKSRESNDG